MQNKRDKTLDPLAMKVRIAGEQITKRVKKIAENKVKGRDLGKPLVAIGNV